MGVVDQVFESPAMRAVIQERDDALEGNHGVTVCIPYHNEPMEVLLRAIKSVFEQTVQPLEIIVVDDGSDNEIILVDKKIRIVRVTNRGLPAARNTGLMLAKGTAFLPLDADDWIEPTYIEKTLPKLGNADVVLVGLQEHGDVRKSNYMPGYDRNVEGVTEEILWQYNRFFYCALFRTELLREIGGYHPAMAGWPGVHGGYEDWDVWIDLRRRGARFEQVNEILLNYNTQGPGMLTRAETNRQVLIDEMKRHHRR